MKQGNRSDLRSVRNRSVQPKNFKKIIDIEIKEVWSKITEKNETCKMMDENFVSLVEEAEKKKVINLVVQANELKRKNEETEEQRKKLQEALKVMIEKEKKLFKELNKPIGLC